MSARSMVRAREREVERDRRRRAKRASVAAGAALGAAVVLAPSAQAATFQVNSKLDDGDGTCDVTCTIRDAIDDANADAAPDTITFAPSVRGTITLVNGELPVDSAMTIEGPGIDEVRISGDANRNNIPDSGDSRVIYVDTDNVGAPYEAVSISGLTLLKGFGGTGGEIYSEYSDLRLDQVKLTNGYGHSVGGVASYGGSLTITDSVITDNYGVHEGGGVYADGPTGSPGPNALVIRNSTISGNYAEGGAGLYVGDELDSALIEGSTFTDNETGSTDSGGGIAIDGPEVSAATIQNSTFSGNAAGYGGGIYVDDTADLGVTVQNTTVTENTAFDEGGGIYMHADNAAAPMRLSSSIVAGNTATSTGNDLDGDGATNVFNVGFSLIGDPSVGDATLNQDPAGTNLLGADPQLGQLADNGGPTRTHLPAATSPVIDAGIANGLTTDQRGLPRTTEQPGANPPGADGTDIGSVELPDTVLDSPSVSAKKTQKQKGKKIKVKVKAGAAEAVSAEASGKVKSFALKTVGADVGAGQQKTLTLKPKQKKGSKKIAKLLAAGKKAKAKISVTLTDSAGNSVTEKVVVKLKAAKKK